MSSTTFFVHIGVESQALKVWRKQKYPDQEADSLILCTTLERLSRKDDEWPSYHVSTLTERERSIKEVITLIQNCALPFFEKFNTLDKLVEEVKTLGFLPHRKHQHLIINQKSVDDFIHCFGCRNTV